MAGNSKAITTLRVDFKADLTGWGKGLKTASTQVDRFYAGIGKALANSPFGKATKAVSDFGKGFVALGKSAVAPLKPLGDGLAYVGTQAKKGAMDVAKLATGVSALAIAGVAATAAFATGGLKRIGDLGDQALTLGIASDKLSELQFAARASGASAEDLNGFLKGLNETVHNSIGQTTTAGNAFKRLGTSAEELTKLSPDQQFAKLKAGFDALPDAASKAQAAVDIGGEAGLKLFKLLGMSAAQFEALKQKSKDTGFTIKPEDLAKVQAANDGFAQIGMVIDGVINQLTVALAPAIAYVSNAFTDWFSGVMKDSNFFPTLVDGFVGGLGKIADTAVSLSLVFRDVFAGIAKAIGNALSYVGNLLQGVAAVVPGMQGIADSVSDISFKVQAFGQEQSRSAGKAREAFEKSKPSESMMIAYDNFKKKTDEQAKATANQTKQTQVAATSNQTLMKSVNDLMTSFDNTISDAGLTSEQKQVAALQRERASLMDVIKLQGKAKLAREAGKRDALAEDLRESTKSPFQKLSEDLSRINQLVREGKLTQTQALKGAAMKTAESGIAGGQVQFAGALQANSIEGRSYLLSQTVGRPQDMLTVARQGLQATMQGNGYLARIADGIANGSRNTTYQMT